MPAQRALALTVQTASSARRVKPARIMRARRTGTAGRRSTNSNRRFGCVIFDQRRPDAGCAPGIEWNSVFGARLTNWKRNATMTTDATATIDPFDKYGAIRRDFTEEEVAALPPDRRARFFVLIEASRNAELAELELKNAEGDVVECMRKHDAAKAQHLKQHPPSTFMEELRKVQRRPTK
jgi:hypothetical protein